MEDLHLLSDFQIYRRQSGSRQNKLAAIHSAAVTQAVITKLRMRCQKPCTGWRQIWLAPNICRGLDILLALTAIVARLT
jgi:hypothetical protein